MMKLFISIVAIVAISLVANYFRWGFDDTDDKRPDKLFGARSGLTLYTDYATGVQYVKCGLFGGSTPRLDSEGKPIIKK